MDRYEWTDGAGWRATVEGGEPEVFEVVLDSDPRRRSASSALGSGSSPRTAAAAEILRLAERVRELESERRPMLDDMAEVEAENIRLRRILDLGEGTVAPSNLGERVFVRLVKRLKEAEARTPRQIWEAMSEEDRQRFGVARQHAEDFDEAARGEVRRLRTQLANLREVFQLFVREVVRGPEAKRTDAGGGDPAPACPTTQGGRPLTPSAAGVARALGGAAKERAACVRFLRAAGEEAMKDGDSKYAAYADHLAVMIETGEHHKGPGFQKTQAI